MNMLRKQRLLAGLSTTELADKAEVGYSVIQYHEKGKRSVYHPHIASQLSKGLDCPLETLFTLTERGWVDKEVGE